MSAVALVEVAEGNFFRSVKVDKVVADPGEVANCCRLLILARRPHFEIVRV